MILLATSPSFNIKQRASALIFLNSCSSMKLRLYAAYAQWIPQTCQSLSYCCGLSQNWHISDRKRYFFSNWAEIIKQCEKSLEPDDIEQVRLITSWDVLQKEVFDPVGSGSRKTIPYEISLIKPTLGHFHHFTHIFESQLAPDLQANFFWGIVGVLLQVSAWLTVPLSNDALLTAL